MAKIIQYRKSTQYLILKWYCFCIGDITEKGYFKKMEQLKKSTECELKSTTPIDAAVDLKKASKDQVLKEHLGKLFGRQTSSSSTSEFVPSAVALKPLKKSKRSVASKSFSRHITAICLHEPSAFIPRRGVRESLAKEGRVRDLKVVYSSSMDDIEDEIEKIFAPFFSEGSSVTYFRADKSNGLAKAAPPQTVDELLELVGRGALYVVNAYKDPAGQSSVSLPTSECLESSACKDPVRESSVSLPTREFLESQLLNSQLGLLWLEQAGLSITDPEEDSPELSEECKAKNSVVLGLQLMVRIHLYLMTMSACQKAFRGVLSTPGPSMPFFKSTAASIGALYFKLSLTKVDIFTHLYSLLPLWPK